MAQGIVGFSNELRTVILGRPGSAQVSKNAISLVKTLFAASLRTEERRPVRCLLTCIQGAKKPKDVLRLAPQPLTPRTITKMAVATEPRSSSLVVEYKTSARQWEIVGVLARDQARGAVGMFQVGIEGPGHLSLRKAGNRTAELDGDTVYTEAYDVFASGPVATKLTSLSTDAREMVKRLLDSIRRLGHGGAILLDSQFTSPHVEIKFRDLGAGYKGLATATAMKDKDHAIWVVAHASRVDGAVTLLLPKLAMQGFGAFLRAPAIPQIWVAGRTDGTQGGLRSPMTLGTRHQSMMSYCAASTTAVGFVVSEDGDIRAMTHDTARGRTTMWERVRLSASDLPAAP